MCSLEAGAAKGRCGVRKSCQLTSRVTLPCHPVTQATFETRSSDPIPTDPPTPPRTWQRSSSLAGVQCTWDWPAHVSSSFPSSLEAPMTPDSCGRHTWRLCFTFTWGLEAPPGPSSLEGAHWSLSALHGSLAPPPLSSSCLRRAFIVSHSNLGGLFCPSSAYSSRRRLPGGRAASPSDL